MADEKGWEYRVQRFGSVLREPKEEEIESALDEWGAEGWEVVSAAVDSGKVLVIAKRPLSLATRRQRSMPGY